MDIAYTRNINMQNLAQGVTFCENFALSGDKDEPTPLPLFPNDEARFDILPYVPSDLFPTVTDERDQMGELLSFVFEKEYIQAARALSFDGDIVVAALTAPFFLKSERDAAREALECELEQLYPNYNVIVAFDLDLFRRMDDGISNAQTLEIIELAKQRQERQA